MTNHYNKRRPTRTAGANPYPQIPAPTATPTPGTTRPGEPEMRRWPHPISTPSAGGEGTTLHYICCSLSYQNQMLADIKSLLEQLAAAARSPLPEIPVSGTFPDGPQVSIPKK